MRVLRERFQIVCVCVCVCACVLLSLFGFEGGVCVLIELVPDHCLSLYFSVNSLKFKLSQFFAVYMVHDQQQIQVKFEKGEHYRI